MDSVNIPQLESRETPPGAAEPSAEAKATGSSEENSEGVQSDKTDEERNIEVKVDYSNFDVMGPWYPEPDYTRGKPCITTKLARPIRGKTVGIGSELFDRTIGMRLYDTKSNMLVLVDAEEAFKHADYATCSYTWKHNAVEQNRRVKEIVRHVTGRARWVWIDAWCIDQDSEDDKIYNIKLMGKIFRYSSQNFIMLLDCMVDQDVAEQLRAW